MLNLSLASSFFASMLVELTLGAGMLALWARGRTRYLALWSAGFFLYGLGYALILLRDRISDFSSIVVGNSCYALCSILFYTGLCIFFKQRRSWLPWAVMALEVALLAWYTYIEYDTTARIYVFCAASGLIALMSLGVLYAAGREHGKSRTIDIAIAILLFLVIAVGRIVGTLLYFPSPQNFLSAGNFQTLSSNSMTLAHIGYALAFGNMYASALRERLNERTMELEALSVTDPLTGLYNRRHFNEVIQRMFGGAQQPGSGMIALSIFDIDHFKQYNDQYGHPQGDVVLQRISQVLRDAMKRHSDFVFRLGGEEFCVIFAASDDGMALRTVETLRQEIEALAIPHPGSPGRVVTASFGLTCARADSGLGQHEVYVLTDHALYEAKAAGRNRVVSSRAPV